MKSCSSCLIVKGKYGFHRKLDGYASVCKVCQNKRIREYQTINKEKIRKQYIDRTYANVNHELLASGKCQICSDTFKRLVVDHDHKSTKVRGYLCRRCNVLLGMAKDQSRILLNAIRYLVNYYEQNI